MIHYVSLLKKFSGGIKRFKNIHTKEILSKIHINKGSPRTSVLEKNFGGRIKRKNQTIMGVLVWKRQDPYKVKEKYEKYK